MKRCSTILISEDGGRSIKVCTSDSAPILCGCELNVKPWKRKPFRGHELLDDGNDAGGGGVVQDGDRVHEVGQGAEEPSNPIKGRALPEQFLHIGPMVQSWSTTQSVEKDCKRQSSTCPCPSRTTFSRCSRSALWISVRRYALVGGGTAHHDDDIYIMMRCLSVCLSRKMSTFSLESPLTIRNHTVQLQVSFYGFSQFGKSDQCRTFLERLENFHTVS